MYLKYGNYTHGVSARGMAGFSVRRVPVETSGVVVAYDEIWDIAGFLYNPGGNPQTIRRMIASLEAAYAVDGGDLVLTTDGSQLTHHVLRSINCRGGTKILAPLQFPTTRGPENVTLRTFTVSVGGRVDRIPPGTTIRFSERISFDGGGPEDGHIVSRNARPFKIRKTQYLPYIVVQEGSATGYGAHPVAPPPFWPQALRRPMARPTVYERGETFGSSVLYPTISWRYEYESAVPLLGLPAYW